MVEAAFTEQTVVHNVVNIKLVQKRVPILADGRGKDDNFIELTNTLHELINARSLNDVHVVVGSFDFDRDGEVGLMEELQHNHQ